ncbi:MAG TPA: zinc-dependent metalloprotease [Candidatus Acidoferrum sp.]|nr:zinc-dependent metalloprotease [Candidatus Acidoferrum sp.]
MRKAIFALFSAIFLLFGSAKLAAQTPSSKADDKKPVADQKPDTGKKSDAADQKSEPPKEKSFADVVKDAQVIKGLFTFYKSEDKVLLEIQPNQFDKMYMLSLTCESGLGEAGFYADSYCGETAIVFHQEGKNIQVIAKNTRFSAQDNSPMARAVAHSFTDSILGSAKRESQPQPERKSELIDLGAIFLTDVPMMAYQLNEVFRIGYHYDVKNSNFGMLKVFDRNVEIETVNHFAVEQPPLSPLLPPGAPPPPMPPQPRNVPDIRSMLFHFRYSISELPGPGFRPRLADDRVGHFFTQVEDYDSDLNFESSRRYIHHWRLEKQDPSAPLSPPKQPIVFWLENTVPVEYRDAIREGVLLWNKAFERVGFKDAVVVKQQPDNADWDPADVRYNTLRWFTGYPDPGFAEGPSRVNPLTGEIYDADIRFDAGMTRFFRREVNEYVNPAGTSWMPWLDAPAKPFLAPWHNGPSEFCDLTRGAVRDAEFAFDLLAARGMDPQGPEAQQFIHDYLVEIAAHEVGHTLGLRHNFRASTIHTLEQAQDAALTAKEGLTGSVMDYIPTNLSAAGQKQGQYHQTTLGPYDYWAIEYAYKPIAANTPDEELPELAKIASRAAEPLLAYDTDEDAGIGGGPFDMDPVVNRFDFGTDPLKFYALRVKLADEIRGGMEKKLEKPGEGYQVLRRSFNGAFGQEGYALFLASKYIGGVYHYRSHVGDPGNRLPFDPVPAAKQKEALDLLRENLFSPKAFQFSPQLLNKLASPRHSDFVDFLAMRTRFDVPIHDMVLSLQNGVMDRLFHPLVLSRILDSEVKVAPAAEAFSLGTLFTGIQDSVWAETKAPADSLNINSYRRSLQRAHLRKMVGMVLRDASVPEDAQTLARQGLVTLRSQLQSALSKPAIKMNVETRAHLSESVARIDEALKANMQRTAF